MTSSSSPGSPILPKLPIAVISASPELGGQLFTSRALERLAAHAHIVRAEGPLNDLPPAVRAATRILITSWDTPAIDESTLDAFPAVEYISHTGGSIKSLVASAAFERGIQISTQADRNAEAVAEYTVAMVIASLKGVFLTNGAYRREGEAMNRWQTFHTLGVTGKTVGIIGASRVGRAVVRLLTRHDVRVLVYDPFLTPEGAKDLGVTLCSLDTVMSEGDVVSLHAPAIPTTHRMITRDLLFAMKPRATFINTARGSLVDQPALVDALAAGRIFAVLDVTDPMLLDTDHTLWQSQNVVLTPHIAGAIGSDLQLLGTGAVDEAIRALSGAPVQYQVSAQELFRLA